MSITLLLTVAILAQFNTLVYGRRILPSDFGFPNPREPPNFFIPGEEGPCPPLVGIRPTPGCSLKFVADVDGDVPCSVDQDCPQSEDWWLDGRCSEGKEIIVGKCSEMKCVSQKATCGVKDLFGLPMPTIIPGEELESQLDFISPVATAKDIFDQFVDNVKKFKEPSCPEGASCGAAGGTEPDSVSLTGAVSVTTSCSRCQETSCPPDKPCTVDGACSRPACNRRGRCWCPRS